MAKGALSGVASEWEVFGPKLLPRPGGEEGDSRGIAIDRSRSETRTAEALLQAKDDARFRQIVGGHFHANAVAGREADKMFAHLAGDVGQNLMVVV